jgi:hypothetical protein
MAFTGLPFSPTQGLTRVIGQVIPHYRIVEKVPDMARLISRFTMQLFAD